MICRIGSFGLGDRDIPKIPWPDGSISIVSLHDYMKFSALSPAHYGDKYISISADQQAVKITSEKFIEWIKKRVSDTSGDKSSSGMFRWLSPLYDFTPENAGLKRAKKSVDRSVNFLDELLDAVACLVNFIS